MRKYLRRIAHIRMRDAGIEQVNKQRDRFHQPIRSKFSRLWREYAAVR